MPKPAPKQWPLLLLALLLWLITKQPVAAQTSTTADFWREIEQTAVLIEQLDPDNPTAIAETTTAAAERLEKITAVSLPNGHTLPLTSQQLITTLRQQPPDLDQLTNQLQALLATQASWPPPRHTTADLNPLATLLSQPQFTYKAPQPSKIRHWLNQQWLRFQTWLNNLLNNNNNTSDPNETNTQPTSLLNIIIPLIGILILLRRLATIGRDLFTNIVTESTLPTDPQLDDANLTADLALDRAQTLSASNDYRTAVRYLYLSALLRLEERGLLRYNRTLTNREYLRSLKNQPDLAHILQNIINIFDRVWYGFQPLGKEEYDHYAKQIASLKQHKGKAK